MLTKTKKTGHDRVLVFASKVIKVHYSTVCVLKKNRNTEQKYIKVIKVHYSTMNASIKSGRSCPKKANTLAYPLSFTP